MFDEPFCRSLKKAYHRDMFLTHFKSLLETVADGFSCASRVSSTCTGPQTFFHSFPHFCGRDPRRRAIFFPSMGFEALASHSCCILLRRYSNKQPTAQNFYYSMLNMLNAYPFSYTKLGALNFLLNVYINTAGTGQLMLHSQSQHFVHDCFGRG